MLGAIIGDIVGSSYEFDSWQGGRNEFPLFSSRSVFTDDTVMTVAVGEGIMSAYGDPEKSREAIDESMRFYGRRYPNAGYGQRFFMWLFSPKITGPYGSFGNGSAMRVSPAGWAYDTLEDVERYAAISAEVTHNHPEGVKGACAVAVSIFLARTGASKQEIRDCVTVRYGYDLSRSLDAIKPGYSFEISCQKSVPEAIIAFLESEDFEGAVRNAVWLGGDSDTQGAIAGSIAEAFYGTIPEKIVNEAVMRLDEFLQSSLSRWQDWLHDKASRP